MSEFTSSGRVWRYSRWDGLLVALSALHAALLVTVPSIPLVAIGLWWNANTISHNFLHRPFFRSRAANRVYALYLSAVLGVPQSVWRARHLRHHAESSGAPDLQVRGVVRTRAPRRHVAFDLLLIATIWVVAAIVAPSTFVFRYLPGIAIGLVLCQLQGHFEHARGTTSHYGRLYNWLFFNDGYHVEHHLRPGEHWTRLTSVDRRDDASSRWPPVLRWLEAVNLDWLERGVLRSRWLQRFVLRCHERALRDLLREVGRPRRVVIVGGGLFPRTALILRRLLPDAALTVVDADERHLAIARSFLNGDIQFIHAMFSPQHAAGADLVVVPLAFRGDRRLFYERPPAPHVVVHDWMWARHGDRSRRVSWLLMKRVNLVLAPRTASRAIA
jgi:fatty acid desaturase